MFYNNKRLAKTENTYKISYSAFSSGMTTNVDDNLLPHKYAKLAFNFKVADGALKTGYGFKTLKLPKTNTADAVERSIVLPATNINGLWHYKYFNSALDRQDDMVLFYGEDNKLYWFQVIGNDPFSYEIANSSFTVKPNAINYRLNGADTIILTSPEDNMQVVNALSSLQVVENAPKFIDLCLHYERVFAIKEGERKRLQFSANLDPTNWNEEIDEGGFIDMLDERGAMNRVISFNDYVFVFRDYGITRLSAYGEQENFTVNHLYVSSAKIFGGSVCACGNRVYFLAKDGLHLFDGSSTTKIKLGIEDMFDTHNENCCSLYANGKYYLACKLNFNDNQNIGCETETYKNNALLEIDYNTGEVFIMRGVDINSILSLEGEFFSKIVCSFNGSNAQKLGELTTDGKVFETSLSANWISPKSNLGYPMRNKRVKELNILSKSDCSVNILTDKQEKTYEVLGSPNTQRIRTDVSGELVQIKFSSTSGDALISCPQIVIGVI